MLAANPSLSPLFQVYNLSQNVQEDDLQHLQVRIICFTAGLAAPDRPITAGRLKGR